MLGAGDVDSFRKDGIQFHPIAQTKLSLREFRFNNV
jgi:hypothetical protein